MSGILVIGIGHPYRGDDGVGPMVAERLAATGVNAVAHHGEGAELMELWQGLERVVVVDATSGGGAPGTVRAWDAVAEKLPAALFPKGSHLFGLAEAVEMSRLLGRLPGGMMVLGVEGRHFAMGAPMSPEVAAAAERLVAGLSSDSEGLFLP
ncbi:hydrogenase maturation protease [Magnetospirillum sp. UT-4]|uniref:hydrogenase maturation protease n=1 Tax=Magnetospirillum sp. UT-4 TaxID=2681467 RepID=UPI00138449D1|nr:hydrogenase maturation protease [Magnetospirillum sp. UT-4]CAA7625611.1 Hydrogenase maturation protease family protein [Magnetospirillum sp. UT-4]